MLPRDEHPTRNRLRDVLNGFHSAKALTTSSIVSSSRTSRRCLLLENGSHRTCVRPISYQLKSTVLIHAHPSHCRHPSIARRKHAHMQARVGVCGEEPRADRQGGPRGTLREPRHVELVRKPRRYESAHVSYHTLEHMASPYWLGIWAMIYITDRLALGSESRQVLDPHFVDIPR
jgi:hypothetical protein